MSNALEVLEQGILPEAGCDYWLGFLTSAIGGTLRTIDEVDGSGQRIYEPDAALDQIRRALDWLERSACPVEAATEQADRQYVGFVVEDVDGEAQAIRKTWAEADNALNDVEAYYYEAETCGHPRARGWVEAKRPFTIRQITRAERDEILENGTPIIDREP